MRPLPSAPSFVYRMSFKPHSLGNIPQVVKSMTFFLSMLPANKVMTSFQLEKR
jgi:hypothetical protein